MSTMCPDHQPSARRRFPLPAAGGQRGFSLVSAIFLLIVLAVLGAFMVSFSTVQHTTSAMDVRGAQAYQAARAGIEWGTYRVLRNNTCAANTALNDVPSFAVTVQCVQAGSYTEGASGVAVYQLTSTARSGTVGGLGYVERQLQATIAK